VVFVTTRRSFNEIHHLAKFIQAAIPEIAVVVQNVNSSAGNVILGRSDFFETKEHELVDKVGSVKFLISPRSFFQINNGAAAYLYSKVLDWSSLSGNETVVDVYCGVGGISLFLSRGAKEVVGFESIRDAVLDAEKNARINGVRNCRFEAGDAEELLGELAENGSKADVVVLNPPRKGCSKKVLENVVHLSPGRVIYVSCSPQTLARDLDLLAGLGYHTAAIQPVDMFPQTPHVENVALLERKSERHKVRQPS
jgi:23S rRNA (uracil1939-C5)-methyltransferase